MPGLDGTGPSGRGAMTGGARGLCGGSDRRAFGRGAGMGFGRRGGRGFQRGNPGYGISDQASFSSQPEPEEIDELRFIAKELKDSLDMINQRLDKLESKE